MYIRGNEKWGCGTVTVGVGFVGGLLGVLWVELGEWWVFCDSR